MERPSIPNIELPKSNLLVNRSRILLLVCGISGCAGTLVNQPNVSGMPGMQVTEPRIKTVAVDVPYISAPVALTVDDDPVSTTDAPKNCPDDMVDIKGEYCIDRYEGSLVDKAEGRELSPYFTPWARPGNRQYKRWLYKAGNTGRRLDVLTPVPEPDEWQISDSYDLQAVSLPGVLPNGWSKYCLFHLRIMLLISYYYERITIKGKIRFPKINC